MPLGQRTESVSGQPACWSRALRVLAVPLGVSFAFFGLLAVLDDAPFRPRHLAMLLNFLGLGFLFVSFGLTGRIRLGIIGGVAAIWCLLVLGLSLVAIGVYTVLLDDTARALGKAVFAVLAFFGALLVAKALRSRHRLLGRR